MENGEIQLKVGFGLKHLIRRLYMIKKLFFIITVINISFQIIYMTFGRCIGIELTSLRFIFYIFRPEYMLVSGIISFIVFIFTIILLIINIISIIVKSKKHIDINYIIILILNIEYIIYYNNFLMMQ